MLVPNMLIPAFDNYDSLKLIVPKQSLTYAHVTFEYSFVKLSQGYTQEQ